MLRRLPHLEDHRQELSVGRMNHPQRHCEEHRLYLHYLVSPQEMRGQRLEWRRKGCHQILPPIMCREALLQRMWRGRCYLPRK